MTITRRLLSTANTSAFSRFARLQDSPRDPIPAILDAFNVYSIIALGETHGNEQTAAVRIALIRTLRFPQIVNDIVVESGNSRYQAVIDRFTEGDAA